MNTCVHAARRLSDSHCCPVDAKVLLEEVDRSKVIKGFLPAKLDALVKNAGGGPSCFGDAPGLFACANAKASAGKTTGGSKEASRLSEVGGECC